MKKLYKMTKGWLRKTSWVLTYCVWVNKWYFFSKYFADVALPAWEDYNAFKPVLMIYLPIFTTKMETFVSRGRFDGNRAKELYCINTEMNFPVHYSLDFQKPWVKRIDCTYELKIKATYFLSIANFIFQNTPRLFRNIHCHNSSSVRDLWNWKVHWVLSRYETVL